MDNNKIYIYLNNLQKSGVTNMFGAAEYIVSAFGIDKNEARQHLSYWMEHYEELKDLKAVEVKQEVVEPTVDELKMRIKQLENTIKELENKLDNLHWEVR